MTPQETVDSTEDEHATCVGERVGEETVDASAPVADDVLGQFLVEVVGEEAADHREPDDEEVDEQVENVEHLVSEVKAEGHGDLREEQEAEVLQVAVEQQRCQEDEGAVGSEEDGDAVVEEEVEAATEDEEGDKDEEEVEGEELPAGGQEGFSSPFHFEEGGLGVIDSVVDCIVDDLFACS